MLISINMKDRMIIYIIMTYPNSGLFRFPMNLQVTIYSYNLILILQHSYVHWLVVFNLAPVAVSGKKESCLRGLPPSHWSVNKSVWS